MAVKIRLMRIGAKKRPFYRVVAVDEHKKRTGGYIELLGTYNPLTTPKEILLKQDRIDQWIKNGAVMSDGFLKIIKQAPQRPPRKPKKAQPEAAAPAPVAAAENAPTEAAEATTEEATAAVEEVSSEAETPAVEENTDETEAPAEDVTETEATETEKAE